MRSIVIGLGETGRPIYNILKKSYPDTSGYDNKILNGNTMKDLWGNIPYGFMNICIPYSKDFIPIVKLYQKTFQPKITIIHSTVPIGTTSQIPDAVHSPIRGRHKQMEQDLMNYVKWVGGEGSHETMGYLNGAGFKCWAVSNSEQTEAMKLLCIAKYGVSIAFSRYCGDISRIYDFDYLDILKWDGEYNEFVDEDLKRPIIGLPSSTSIGGHCIIPNIAILNEMHPNPMLSEILRYG